MISRKLSLLYLILSTLCWGSAIPLNKYLVYYIHPLYLIVIQTGISAMILLVALAITLPGKKTKLKTLNIRWLVILAAVGSLEPGLAYYLEFAGLTVTSSLHASIILATEPLGILALNIFLFRMTADARLILAALIALSGVLIIVFSSEQFDPTYSLLGDMMIFLGTMAASLYVALSTHYFMAGSVLVMLAIQQWSSCIFMIMLFGIFSSIHGMPPVPHLRHILEASAVGVLQFTLGFFFYFKGVAAQNNNHISVVILNMTPIIGIIGSILLLGEASNMLYFLGAVMTLAATFYVGLKGEAQATP